MADATEHEMGVADDRVAILDAGAQYGKVIRMTTEPICFECRILHFFLRFVGH